MAGSATGIEASTARKDEGNNFGKRHGVDPSIVHQDHNQGAVEHRQVADHAEHGLLLRTYDMGVEHKLRGTAELRPRSGRCHLRNRLAPPYHRPSVGLKGRAGFDGDGLAGEHGLIDLNRSLNQAHVGGNHGPQRQLHDVASARFGGGKIRPDAIPADRRRERQPRL